MSIAFVFPGQGSQAVGMGKALADNFTAARDIFAQVDDALGEKLTATIWDGPVERLTLTENAQPALMAVSLATMRVLEREAGVDLARDAAFVAGHSLGEYSALAAAGSISIADTARLLRIRGRAMQAAVPVGAGAMAALLGLEFDAAAAVAAADNALRHTRRASHDRYRGPTCPLWPAVRRGRASRETPFVRRGSRRRSGSPAWRGSRSTCSARRAGRRP
jgi:malonyl CoA-acyl carrier protein transacylase